MKKCDFLIAGKRKYVRAKYYFHLYFRNTVNYCMPVVILKIKNGLSRDQKRRIVEEFTQTLVSTAGVPPERVTVLIDEHAPEDIGIAGKLRCD
jgi:4-oxalocrotonate tautomerase